jgi:hypothetical protein
MTKASIAIAGLGVAVAGLVGLQIARSTPHKEEQREITLLHLAQCGTMCREYYRLFKVWPSSVTDLAARVPGTPRTCILDGWGRPLQILMQTNAAPGTAPRLVSYGADGQPGGDGEDADIDLFL